MFKYYFYYKASLNKLFENIPSTYKINTLLYESISTKRPYESTIESKNCKSKQNNYFYLIEESHFICLIICIQLVRKQNIIDFYEF